MKIEARNVVVDPAGSRQATWNQAGKKRRGHEFEYSVVDGNYNRLNKWTFVVRHPNAKDAYIEVRPVRVPARASLAQMERRSLLFQRATKHPHRAHVYCKLSLADPTNARTKVVARRGDKADLPEWFDYFRRAMFLKGTVTTSNALDLEQQVVLIRPHDHQRMIRLFLASKAWVALNKFKLP